MKLRYTESGSDNPEINFSDAAKILYRLNDHYLSHFIRCYNRFGGDLELCIVLGEIAHYNTKEIFKNFPKTESATEDIYKALKGCNAHSISMSSGIPRETVRRKVKKLEKLGFINIDDKNQIFITPKPSQEFSDFNKETLELFFNFMNNIKNIA